MTLMFMLIVWCLHDIVMKTLCAFNEMSTDTYSKINMHLDMVNSQY